MSHRNVAFWNDMIAGCTENGVADEVLVLFYRMNESGIEPDHFTLVGVLDPCADLAALGQGKKIHEEVRRGRLGIVLSNTSKGSPAEYFNFRMYSAMVCQIGFRLALWDCPWSGR